MSEPAIVAQPRNRGNSVDPSGSTGRFQSAWPVRQTRTNEGVHARRNQAIVSVAASSANRRHRAAAENQRMREDRTLHDDREHEGADAGQRRHEKQDRAARARARR